MVSTNRNHAGSQSMPLQETQTGYLDLPTELRQTIICLYMGWDPDSPPLTFAVSTQNKLYASVIRNNARLKRKDRKPLKFSQYLKRWRLTQEEHDELDGLRIFHLVCKQSRYDIEGLLGMSASEVIISNNPRTMRQILTTFRHATVDTTWLENLALNLFPKNDKPPTSPNPLICTKGLVFAQRCGIKAIDQQSDGQVPRYIDTCGHFHIVNKHLRQWIKLAHELPANIRSIKAEVDVHWRSDCYRVHAHPDAADHLRNLVEVIKVLRQGMSDTCSLSDRDVKLKYERKVTVIGKQAQADLGLSCLRQGSDDLTARLKRRAVAVLKVR